ncbi:hypothetical protein FOFC_04097 [Fusarium oxysporum]|nr:hypothetical protein FOFC_04097 [Fusarium oxysporum]
MKGTPHNAVIFPPVHATVKLSLCLTSPNKQALITPYPDQIWKHDAEGAKALVNLSETCQAPNAVTLPHLYHRVRPDKDILETLTFRIYSPDHRHEVFKFARSLSLTDTLTRRYINGQRLDAEEQSFSFDAMLKMMPNIQLLHLSFYFIHYERNLLESTRLESLRYLHIEGPELDLATGEPHNLQNASLFQQAPKIDTLVIRVYDLSWSSRSMGLGNVKCLKIVNTCVNQSDLNFLVGSCPQLEQFVFIVRGKTLTRREIDLDYVTLQTLPQVLSLRQGTLRYLEVYCRYRGPPYGVALAARNTIVSSLKDLINLETFILGGQYFPFKVGEGRKPPKYCLVDLLPPSIHSVTIESKDQNLYEPMCALAEAVRSGSFTKLKEVRQYNFDMKRAFRLARYEALDNDTFRESEELGRRNNFDEEKIFFHGMLLELSRGCNVSFCVHEEKLFPNSLATPKPGKLWGRPSAEDTTGLLSLARTCRVLNEAATPYIYHNIDARGWPEEKITEFLRDRRQLQERSFVRRLTYEVDPFPLYTLLCRMPGLQLLSLVDRGNSFGQTLASKAQKKLQDLRYLHLKNTHIKAVRDLSTLENFAPMLSLRLRSLETFERLQTLVLGGDSPFIGISCKDEATHTFTVKTLDPASLVELLPASIVEVRIDSKHLHGVYVERRQNPKIILGSPANHHSRTTMEVAQHFIKAESLTNVKTAGEGLECLVYKASSPVYGPVVLRVPRVKIYQNANDPNTNASDLIQQEMKIYKLLQNDSVPVPRAYKYLEEDGYPAMLCEYVDDDGTEITFEEMGRVAAMIHSSPLSDPAMKTVALETADVFSTIEQRLKRRFSVLSQTVPEASSWIANWAHIHTVLEGLKRFPSSLLHMDFRDVNLRHKDGRISAVIDWTNALVGPAAIDLFRTLEFNQLDESFIKGYNEVTTWPDVASKEECLLRLDAALVLALVFTSEAPDAERAEVAVARVKELSKSLVEATSHD